MTNKKFHWQSLLPVVLAFLAFGITVSAQSRKIEKCNVRSKDQPKYDVIFEQKNDLAPYWLGVDIVVRPENFNADFMRGLADTLTRRYCHDNYISVTIYDEKRAARNTTDSVMALYLRGRIKVPALRGFYSFDKDSKHVGVSYSTKRGNPTDEVRIELPFLAYSR